MSILDMSDALDGFEQPVVFTEKKTISVNFEEYEECTDITIPAVIQPAQKESLTVDNVDYSKKYILIHSTEELKINYFVTWRGKEFKIIDLGDYVDYCFYEAVGEEVKEDCSND